MVQQYGEIYHTAWKKATGQSLLCLENDCLQDLANHCVHAASPTLASAIRRILGTFHAKKKYQNVDEMLHRIYEPILWRSMQVANPTVRKQSALLFIDAFPIQDPEAPQADFEQCMQRQISALQELMMDDDPSVREVGVMCVGKALSVFWDLMPLQTCQARPLPPPPSPESPTCFQAKMRLPKVVSGSTLNPDPRFSGPSRTPRHGALLRRGLCERASRSHPRRALRPRQSPLAPHHAGATFPDHIPITMPHPAAARRFSGAFFLFFNDQTYVWSFDLAGPGTSSAPPHPRHEREGEGRDV